jgi:hypothetical protein
MTGEQKLERITPQQVKDIQAQQYAHIEEEKSAKKIERGSHDWAKILRPRGP